MEWILAILGASILVSLLLWAAGRIATAVENINR